VSDIQARVRHLTPFSTASMHDRFLVGVEFIALPPSAATQIELLVAAGSDAHDGSGEGH
jgi:hypothetical protein